MNRVSSAPLPGTQIDPRYPDSDGRPMGDTEFHTQALHWLLDALKDYYAAVPNVYIASNIIMYYKQGDPKTRRDPDILVAKGVGKHRRRAFRVWEEKVVPCVLFEVASKDTWRVDVDKKPAEYAGIGVKEYFVFDPEGKYLDPALQGFRTVKGKPVPMKRAADGSLVSKQLGLRFVAEGEMLRLIDVETGEPIPTKDERNEQDRQRAEQERQLREQADQRTAQERQLREQADQRTAQERQLREQADQRAAQERQLREQADQRAEQDRQRAEELEAELRRLRQSRGNHG
jgi:Uma2 family endonuclease